MRTRRFTAPLIALILTLPLLTACGKTVSETSDDADITTRVKTVFINDKEIGSERIEVDTLKGIVTLSGRVKSKQQEEKAVALARTVRGVVEVKSTLQVGGL
jgi:hyperosmotically inducible protein